LARRSASSSAHAVVDRPVAKTNTGKDHPITGMKPPLRFPDIHTPDARVLSGPSLNGDAALALINLGVHTCVNAPIIRAMRFLTVRGFFATGAAMPLPPPYSAFREINLFRERAAGLACDERRGPQSGRGMVKIHLKIAGGPAVAEPPTRSGGSPPNDKRPPKLLFRRQNAMARPVMCRQRQVKPSAPGDAQFHFIARL
jgi:hypothetical protein